MKRLSDYVERKLSYSRKMGATLEAAKSSKNRDLPVFDDFSVAGVSDLSFQVNRYWGNLARSAEQRLSSIEMLSGQVPDTVSMEKLREIFKGHTSSLIEMISKTTVKLLPGMDIVVWSKEQSTVASMGHEQLVNARIMLDQIPMEPQVWMYESGAISGIEITTTTTNRVTNESIDGVIIYPIHVTKSASDAKISPTNTGILCSLFAGVITRNQGKFKLVWMPLVSYYARDGEYSKYEGYMLDPSEPTVDIGDGVGLASDEYGVVLRVCPGEIQSTLIAQMLYMQEGYVDTSPERVRVRGVARRGEKAKDHTSDVLVVKIRKKLGQKHSETSGESGINYTCQWAVRPHWRRYTKPLKNGSCVTRVPGYVKGPEGMPMKAKTRIFEVVQ